MATLEGYAPLKFKLSKMVKDVKEQKAGVVIGHAMPYSMLVHETHKHQAKFLENAYREELNSGRARATVREEYKKHKNLQKALFKVGNNIKVTSQANTPVKTGALRASAFVSRGGGKGDTAYRARVRGNELIQAYYEARQAASNKRKRK